MRIAVTVVAMGVFVVHALHYAAAWSDDAFLTFRYAQNVASGLGPVFNAGQRIEGITNLGYALLLAPFAGGDLLAVSRVFGLVAGVATVGVLSCWCSRLSLPASMAALATFVCTPWAPTWTMMGLETATAMFLATLAWTQRRALATTIGIWIRPDLALFAVLTPKSWMLALGVAALVAAKLYWFDAIVPNTFYVKAGNVAEGLTYLERFATVPSPVLPALVFAATAYGMVRRSLPAWVWAVWVFAVVLQGGDFMANYRFFVPAWPAACAAVGFAVDAIIRRFPGAATSAGIVALFAVALAAPLQLLRADELNRIGSTPFQPRKLAPFFAPWRSPESGSHSPQMPFAAAWSVVNLRDDAAVAYTDVGMLSYVYEGRVIDLLGLHGTPVVGHATVLISDDRPSEWPLVDGCDIHRVYRNPALAWERPSDETVLLRLERVLRIAPRHHALHLAIARELNHVRSGLTAGWLEQLRELPALHQHSLADARCEAGITCPEGADRCLGGQLRLTIPGS